MERHDDGEIKAGQAGAMKQLTPWFIQQDGLSLPLCSPPSCSNLSIVCHYRALWSGEVRGGIERNSLSLSPPKLIIWSTLSLSVCFILLFAPLLRFISEYSLILLFPWLYARVIGVYAGVCVFKASLTGCTPNWAWEVFCWWETAGYEREKEWEVARDRYKGDKGKAGGWEGENLRRCGERMEEEWVRKEVREKVTCKGGGVRWDQIDQSHSF